MTDAPISLSVIIPAFNEERRVPTTLDQLASFLDARGWDWEIRVVDDGSTDGTARIVEQKAEVAPPTEPAEPAVLEEPAPEKPQAKRRPKKKIDFGRFEGY